MPDDPRDPVARLFVALELPARWKSELIALCREQERLSPGYFRWVRPELLHLTVLFIGEQPAEAVPTVGAALERAASNCADFELELGRLGTFGRPSWPSVLWVQAREAVGRLARLRKQLEDVLTQAGVTFDAKPLQPHVTLGRARTRAGACRALVQRLVRVPPHRVEQVALLESRLTPGGPVYSVRARVALAKS